MRDIDPILQARLDSGATTMCRCWRVTRVDGSAMGFTDHDEVVRFEGTDFEAGTGLDAGAIESSTGLSVDNTQAIGALSAAGMTDADIMSGRYDRASVEHWIVDWKMPELRVLLFKGYLGEIKRGEGQFSAELRGLSEDLNRKIGRNYLYECDRVVGDGKCKFDFSRPGFTLQVAVDQVISQRKFRLDGIAPLPEAWYENGRVEWMTGANANTFGVVKFDIPAGAARNIELWQETAFPILPGDMVMFFAGCDKQPDTCKIKFENFLNYRGFPHLPGEDWVTSYPANGDVHDGTSRSSG